MPSQRVLHASVKPMEPESPMRRHVATFVAAALLFSMAGPAVAADPPLAATLAPEVSPAPEATPEPEPEATSEPEPEPEATSEPEPDPEATPAPEAIATPAGG